MVSAKYMVIALFVVALLSACLLENTDAKPFGGMMGGKGHGGSDIGHLLAAGLVISLLRGQGFN